MDPEHLHNLINCPCNMSDWFFKCLLWAYNPILFDVSPAQFGKGRWRCDLQSNETDWKVVCEVWGIAPS